MIVPQTMVSAAKDQICTEVGEDAVILNLLDGVYYGLNPLGAYIWKMIQQPRAVADICDAIMKEYTVERERCMNDLVTLLEDMAAHKLVEIQDGPANAR
jgi:hypothetical protein